MRFFEYFEAYLGSPWLDLLFKLDVVRQASIPFRDAVIGQTSTPLQCVLRVRNVEVLADTPTKNRLPVRLDLDVQGIGAWTHELAVYMPTAEQMAERVTLRPEFEVDPGKLKAGFVMVSGLGPSWSASEVAALRRRQAGRAG
jgi:hypothetical protein